VANDHQAPPSEANSVGSDSTPGIPPGTIVLEKYRVIRNIGVGGMGVVVSATHTSLGTPVAIKFLLPQYASSADATRRFLREAQAASKIASEHIVRVFDTGISQPWGPYIVMEFLEGDDLSRRLRRGPLSVELAIDFVVQSGLALAEAHANGIVHRDVKPANLYVTDRPDGTGLVKVLDFGISKVAEASSMEVTKTQAILGSGLYMSPEQMKSSKAVDLRTDIYALGITMFELLTRTQPYTAESFAELAIKVATEPPTPLLKYRPDVSPELASVIERAYAKRPEDRYQSMGEFAIALAPWAWPSTRDDIDSLARSETRRGRAPSIAPPGVLAITGGPRSNPPPSLYPSGNYADLRIPPAPSLPTPASVGVDTFGLSKKETTPDSMKRTELAHPSRSRTLLLVGLGLGVALAAAVAFLVLRDPGEKASPEASTPSATPAVATGDEPLARRSNEPIVSAAPRESATSAPTTSATARAAPTSAPTTSATSAPTSTAAPATPTAAATPTPTPTTPPPATGAPKSPCTMRDLEGNLVPCPGSP
jgi:eukaryotic-like serine/threonine-protein kinase